MKERLDKKREEGIYINLDEEAWSITFRRRSSTSVTINPVQTWKSGGCIGMRMSKLESRQKWQLEKLDAQEYWKWKVLV